MMYGVEPCSPDSRVLFRRIPEGECGVVEFETAGGRVRVPEVSRLAARFPKKLLAAVRTVGRRLGSKCYLVGGTVRDWLLDRPPHDLDLVIAEGAVRFCRELIGELGGGAFVLLGTDEEEAGRVVWQGIDIDISVFRGGAVTLAADLALRDFTVNSIAVPLEALFSAAEPRLIDPLRGMEDLNSRLLRHDPGAFEADPLRLVRTFRFMATLSFQPVAGTLAEVRRLAGTIKQVAAERVSHELDCIMASEAAADSLWQMHECGLLGSLFPELYAGYGVEQPSFHHLDVFHHNFQALREMEKLLAGPEKFFGPLALELRDYLMLPRSVIRLKWAALFHDVAKPEAQGESEKEPGRVTFYRHDDLGGERVEIIGRRLKWSNSDREQVSRLVTMHMHPFHLANVRRTGEISARAALKLWRRAGELLAGLFLLAMADSLAGQGELKPETMEEELVALFGEVLAPQRERIGPALAGPPLVNGRDLIDHFGLEPGPVFEILDELLALQVEGSVCSRDAAFAWVERYISDRRIRQNGTGYRR